MQDGVCVVFSRKQMLRWNIGTQQIYWGVTPVKREGGSIGQVETSAHGADRKEQADSSVNSICICFHYLLLCNKLRHFNSLKTQILMVFEKCFAFNFGDEKSKMGLCGYILLTSFSVIMVRCWWGLNSLLVIGNWSWLWARCSAGANRVPMASLCTLDSQQVTDQVCSIGDQEGIFKEAGGIFPI